MNAQHINHHVDKADGKYEHNKQGSVIKNKTARGHSPHHKTFHDEHKSFNTVEANYLKETFEHEASILAHSTSHVPKLGRNPILGELTRRETCSLTSPPKSLPYSSSSNIPRPDAIDEDFQKFLSSLEDVKTLNFRREIIEKEMKTLEAMKVLRDKLDINPPLPKRTGIDIRVINAKKHHVASPSFTFK